MSMWQLCITFIAWHYFINRELYVFHVCMNIRPCIFVCVNPCRCVCVRSGNPGLSWNVCALSIVQQVSDKNWKGNMYTQFLYVCAHANMLMLSTEVFLMFLVTFKSICECTVTYLLLAKPSSISLRPFNLYSQQTVLAIEQTFNVTSTLKQYIYK